MSNIEEELTLEWAVLFLALTEWRDDELEEDEEGEAEELREEEQLTSSPTPEVLLLLLLLLPGVRKEVRDEDEEEEEDLDDTAVVLGLEMRATPAVVVVEETAGGSFVDKEDSEVVQGIDRYEEDEGDGEQDLEETDLETRVETTLSREPPFFPAAVVVRDVVFVVPEEEERSFEEECVSLLFNDDKEESGEEIRQEIPVGDFDFSSFSEASMDEAWDTHDEGLHDADDDDEGEEDFENDAPASTVVSDEETEGVVVVQLLTAVAADSPEVVGVVPWSFFSVDEEEVTCLIPGMIFVLLAFFVIVSFIPVESDGGCCFCCLTHEADKEDGDVDDDGREETPATQEEEEVQLELETEVHNDDDKVGGERGEEDREGVEGEGKEVAAVAEQEWEGEEYEYEWEGEGAEGESIEGAVDPAAGEDPGELLE